MFVWLYRSMLMLPTKSRYVCMCEWVGARMLVGKYLHGRIVCVCVWRWLQNLAHSFVSNSYEPYERWDKDSHYKTMSHIHLNGLQHFPLFAPVVEWVNHNLWFRHNIKLLPRSEKKTKPYHLYIVGVIFVECKIEIAMYGNDDSVSVKVWLFHKISFVAMKIWKMAQMNISTWKMSHLDCNTTQL